MTEEGRFKICKKVEKEKEGQTIGCELKGSNVLLGETRSVDVPHRALLVEQTRGRKEGNESHDKDVY